MIQRYSNKKMSKIWTQESKYQAWLDVEKAAVKAWSKLGLVPKDDAQKIIDNASFNAKEVDEIEKKTKHDMIAFLTSVAHSLGKESRWVHYGLTSSDCIDTANSLLMVRSLEVILKDLSKLKKTLKNQSIKHKLTLIVGRSHGIHAEPTTFGLVVANWYSEITRNITNIKQALKVISVGQMSGAVGNFAHSPLELEELVCEYLSLTPTDVSNQVIQRDRYANLVNALALLGASCEKISIAIRHFQRTEVYEVEEFFDKNQKGSSAMPHKRNPILSENITGLCRMIRSYASPTMENVPLWHERDISHSSVERFILPDIFITTDFMLTRLDGVIAKLVVHEENMMKNLMLTGGLVFSQRVLLELPLKGVSREDSYKIVQKNAMLVWADLKKGKLAVDDNNNSLFLKYLLQDKKLLAKLKKDDIKACFNFNYYTKNVDNIFKRIFKKT